MKYRLELASMCVTLLVMSWSPDTRSAPFGPAAEMTNDDR